MLLIGSIKKELKGSSLIEVLIAMIIIMACFSAFVMFSVRLGSGKSIKDGLETKYLVRKEYIDLYSGEGSSMIYNEVKFSVANDTISDGSLLYMNIYIEDRDRKEVANSKFYLSR